MRRILPPMAGRTDGIAARRKSGMEPREIEIGFTMTLYGGGSSGHPAQNAGDEAGRHDAGPEAWPTEH